MYAFESVDLVCVTLISTFQVTVKTKMKMKLLMPILRLCSYFQRVIAHLWLSAKQRTWKAGTARYIPNSVWNWMVSASGNYPSIWKCTFI